MYGYGAGETGKNRFCGEGQLRRCGSTEGSQPFVPGCRGGSALLGSRGNAHWRVEGSQPHRVKGETPCPGKVDQKITALYCRISLEDGGDNESMSISNQKLMLRDFAEKNGMFQYEYYVDDGYTGRNFNRPSFQRMIADIEAGKIGCVITKDLSRLGRNYIEAGSYIEIFFPKHNVRYIAITDGVDSLTRQEMDITPFKNILNDMYSRDISKKVLAGRMTRSRQGKFCGGQPPLGLMRDPEDKGHLIRDPETAPVIRKIYDMALDGWGCMRIAKQLMDDKVPITRVKSNTEFLTIWSCSARKPRRCWTI